MAVPSVTRFTRNGVTFEGKVDQANYYIEELTRAAMKDVGRLVTRACAKQVRGINAFTRRARYAPKRYQYWVRKKECDLQVGVENTKFGANTAWWADQSELGSNGQPKRGILRSAVYDNIDQIIKIESQYLSALSGDDPSGLVDESEAQGTDE